MAEVRQEFSDIKEINKEKLEKYVGAVQKLRDGPQATEILAKR